MAIGAMFKRGGYRSVGNYITVAKQKHVIFTGDWPDDLRLMATNIERAVTRDQGPAKQAATFSVHAVADQDMQEEPLNTGGPWCPVHAMLLGAFFLLREVELAATRRCHITVDAVRRSFSWLLPKSKTDVKALGATRSWGCICGDGFIEYCPFPLDAGCGIRL